MKWKSLTDSAYAPYSGINNVAALLGESGNWYPGVRVENVSYPLTITADQSALFQCLSRKDTPEELYLHENFVLPEFRKKLWEQEYNLKVATSEEIQAKEWYNPYVKINKTEKDTLKELLNYAVTPNSDFQVSCLLKTTDGKYIPGVNIEVSDWQTGLCAERVALSTALAFGVSNFEYLHVHAPKSDFVSPCGACRQVIIEHMPEKLVYLTHADQTTCSFYTSHLLPFTFSSNQLNRD